MATVPKFRIDANVHSQLMNSESHGPEPTINKGMTLPEPIYPRFPEKLSDPGPEMTERHQANRPTSLRLYPDGTGS